jgi:hypothetical protein
MPSHRRLQACDAAHQRCGRVCARRDSGAAQLRVDALGARRNRRVRSATLSSGAGPLLVQQQPHTSARAHPPPPKPSEVEHLPNCAAPRCQTIVLATPPRPDGTITPEVCLGLWRAPSTPAWDDTAATRCLHSTSPCTRLTAGSSLRHACMRVQVLYCAKKAGVTHILKAGGAQVRSRAGPLAVLSSQRCMRCVRRCPAAPAWPSSAALTCARCALFTIGGGGDGVGHRVLPQGMERCSHAHAASAAAPRGSPRRIPAMAVGPVRSLRLTCHARQQSAVPLSRAAACGVVPSPRSTRSWAPATSL